MIRINRCSFDSQPRHTSIKPSLRRVQSPEKIAKVFFGVMCQAAMVDYYAELIGLSIRFHHREINFNLPRTQTAVKFTRTFLFSQ